MLRLAQESKDNFALAVAQQSIGAYLFAMRSCEYVKTCFREESKRTKILRVRNIRFFLRNRLIRHSDIRSFSSDVVNITFEWQKNDERDESVSMHRSKQRGLQDFNPVYVWASIVTRVIKYPGEDDILDRKLNTVFTNRRLRK